jgi:D-alanyl-lipoteichoic acid acyltransferase DltB (MBOAT superfamily)
VAGPIERATNLLPQILAPRHFGWARFGSGAWLVLWGIFKKVVIADNLAALVDHVYRPGFDPTGAEVLLATYGFALQIYCDFSGYSDIARGVARLLGFELMLNFHLPYLAASPAEFWRRWHISLSTWLRDYLYISLGGNRRGRRRTYRNLMITMLLGGLWHGAAWTFVFWGAFHGAWLCLHRALRPALQRARPTRPAASALWRVLCVLVTFHLVCLGWMIFRAESLGHLVALLNALVVSGELGSVPRWLLPFGVLVAPLVLMQLAQALSGRSEAVLHWRMPLRVGVYVLLFFAIVVLGEDFGVPFIYFQF